MPTTQKHSEHSERPHSKPSHHTHRRIPFGKALKIRVTKNLSSTILGAVFMCVALLLVIFDKITWTEYIAFLPTCIGLIYVKDTIFHPTRDTY